MQLFKWIFAGLVLVLFVGCSTAPTSEPPAALSPARPVTALSTVTQFQTPLVRGYQADPMMVTHNGYYYLLYNDNSDAQGARITKASSLAGLATTAPTTVWTGAADGINCTYCVGFILHSNARWYLYGADFVLESAADDPMGPYSFKARLATVNNSAVIATFPFYVGSQLYLFETSIVGGANSIHIAKMSNPWTVSSNFTRIAQPTAAWECRTGYCVDEGSSVIVKGSKVYNIFSASSYESPDYCVGMLVADIDANLLNSTSWVKSPNCVFSRNNAAGAYGPGSMQFFKSPDGTQDWVVYHIKTLTGDILDGDDRQLQAKQVTWNGDGSPNFGSPVAPETALPLPSGDAGTVTDLGPQAIYEAEQGVVTAARIRKSASASGGFFVGNIDEASSKVTLPIKVTSAGSYTLTLRYANGTGAASTHALSINGASAQMVSYPPTAGWGQFSTSPVTVNLIAGTNTLRFTKGMQYAELDSVGVTSSAPVQEYEAENADVTNASRRSSGNASGGSYVGGIDFADSAVQSTVNVPSGGSYVLSIRYANGTGSASSQRLAVNGGASQTVTYPPTAGWAQFDSVNLNVTLNAGSNTVRLSQGAVNGYAELDVLRIFPRLEAENAAVNNADRRTSGNASNNGFVGGIDFASSFVEFANVYASVPGNYLLRIRYANGTGGTTTQQLTVNGAGSTPVSYPATPGWGQFALVTVPVTLTAGNNTLRFTHAGFAELDYIEVFR
ncbi:carbohydrate-binding protein [Deinococcus sp. Arct2-2]|uniref:family 43 glycosylhydrolase n=1 Tax=Deinococcus sp. Arct2-2 TaxID=2568653 RepID=UPI0010A4FA08|nr:CBM35 domain-containing protein [Deinococcus sp. Arct2-2]THF66745.1 carbohydrate-binding protein [Deinococcus sp. Arct2-2]